MIILGLEIMKMSHSTCRIGLHLFIITFYVLTVDTTSLESRYCGSTVTNASCSRLDNRGYWACEDWMKYDNISPGDLFDKLMDGSNCSGEFILGKTGFNLTILENSDTDTVTHCATGFDPHRTWDQCSDVDRSCEYSAEVCDADSPGESCFTTESSHVNGYTNEFFGSGYYDIFSVFVDGQLPCTRCLLQLRYHYEDGSSAWYCLPLAIKRDEPASKDNPGSHQDTIKTTMASSTAVNDEEMVKTTMAGTPGVSDEEMVKTTVAGTTTGVSDEEMVKTTSTTNVTKSVLQTTQPGDSDDGGDQLDIGEKGTNSGNDNTQVGHITIFFSTMFTLIIVLF